MILAIGFGVGCAPWVAGRVAWTHATSLGTAATVPGIVSVGTGLGRIIRIRR
jgi:hypothetical protein